MVIERWFSVPFASHFSRSTSKSGDDQVSAPGANCFFAFSVNYWHILTSV